MSLQRDIVKAQISTWTDEIIDNIPQDEWERWSKEKEHALLILVGAAFFAGDYQKEFRLDVSSGPGPSYVTGSNIHEGLWGKSSVEKALIKINETPETAIAKLWAECEERLRTKNLAWPTLIREGVADSYSKHARNI
ncbi:hypothetical protein [Acetobacter persici]|uniref:hypothetical protein n=1 Tax=Acetobacter persici TaxID=1076596 RepID=UPI0039EB4A64